MVPTPLKNRYLGAETFWTKTRLMGTVARSELKSVLFKDGVVGKGRATRASEHRLHAVGVGIQTVRLCSVPKRAKRSVGSAILTFKRGKFLYIKVLLQEPRSTCSSRFPPKVPLQK